MEIGAENSKSKLNPTRMIGFLNGAPAEWADRDLEAMWRHLLRSPVQSLIRSGSVKESSRFDTVENLLGSEDVSLDFMKRAIDFTKAAMMNQESPLPRPVGNMLITALLSMALLRYDYLPPNRPKDRMLDDLRRALQRSWIDETTRASLQAALSKLELSKDH